MPSAWRRSLSQGNADVRVLVAIIAVSVVCGCASRPPLPVGARDTNIRATASGFRIGDERVGPEEIVARLEEADIPRRRTIHIRVDGDVRNLSPARALMRRLARAGYRSSVLVTERHAEADVVAGPENPWSTGNRRPGRREQQAKGNGLTK